MCMVVGLGKEASKRRQTMTYRDNPSSKKKKLWDTPYQTYPEKTVHAMIDLRVNKGRGA